MTLGPSGPVQVAQATDAGLSVRLKLRSQKGVPIRNPGLPR